MMKLAVSPEVIKDIKEIKSYIRDVLCNAAAADRISSALIKSYKSLKESPYIGRRLDSKFKLITDYRY